MGCPTTTPTPVILSSEQVTASLAALTRNLAANFAVWADVAREHAAVWESALADARWAMACHTPVPVKANGRHGSRVQRSRHRAAAQARRWDRLPS